MINFRFHKINYLILGSMFGIFANIIRICGDLIAILLYPGYNLTIHMISFLGSSPGHKFFTFGLILSAILIIPFYLSIVTVFKNEFPEKEKLIHRSLQVLIISAISLSLVGFFLELSNIILNPLIYDLHGFFAVIAFSCAVFSCVVMGILIQKSIYFPHFFAYMCYIVAGVNLIFLFTWHALLEWLSSSLVIILQLSLGVYLICKKLKYKQDLIEYRRNDNKLLINEFLRKAKRAFTNGHYNYEAFSNTKQIKREEPSLLIDNIVLREYSLRMRKELQNEVSNFIKKW